MRLYSAICGDLVPKFTTFIVENDIRYVGSGLGFLVYGHLCFVLDTYRSPSFRHLSLGSPWCSRLAGDHAKQLLAHQ
ncbi:hypothetical protein EV363DRAFT_1259239, partial [Boletus edulis]